MESSQQVQRALDDVAVGVRQRQRAPGLDELNGASHRAYHEALRNEALAGKRALELGFGTPDQARFLAENGARVTAIDTSPPAVQQAQRAASAAGFADRATFRVMDAESLELDDSAFDLVCGSSVLLHLELTSAYAEIARVLRPDGAAIFLEPLGHNALINAYRRRTPALRDSGAEPLVVSDLEQAREHFADVRLRYFNLASLAAFPLRRQRGFEQLVSALDRTDRHLFKLVPPVKRYAWLVLMRMAEPIKPGSTG